MLTDESSSSFRNWQPEYAARNIPTFPVQISPDAKKPMVKNYCRFGIPGSAEIAQRFPDATAIGFMAGRRTGLTVLDVDTSDEQVLADALDRHGPTPVIVRSGSGHHQAWYRHNGERRLIRCLYPDKPIDILGSGVVVAPPSHGIKGDHQFIQGKLDDLDRLPVMQNIEITASPSPSISLDLPEEKFVPDGKRHKALLRHCMKQAHSCDDFETLLDVAKTRNDGYLPPMPDEDVIDIAKWAWDRTVKGKNWFGQPSARITNAEVDSIVGSNPDALSLLTFLRAKNGPDSTFMVANKLAGILWLSRQRFTEARSYLEQSHLEMVRRPSLRNGAALYRWRKLER